MTCPSLPRGFFLRPFPLPEDRMPLDFPLPVPLPLPEKFPHNRHEVGDKGRDALTRQLLAFPFSFGFTFVESLAEEAAYSADWPAHVLSPLALAFSRAQNLVLFVLL